MKKVCFQNLMGLSGIGVTQDWIENKQECSQWVVR